MTMSNKVVLEEVECMAIQLPPNEQLKLIVKIGENLNGLLLQKMDEEQRRLDHAKRIEAFIKMCDDMKVKTIGKTDSVEDIHQIREERMARF
jgi:hypothetical protein